MNLETMVEEQNLDQTVGDGGCESRVMSREGRKGRRDPMRERERKGVRKTAVSKSIAGKSNNLSSSPGTPQ